MIRRLIMAFYTTLLLCLGLQIGSTTPVYASTLQAAKQTLLAVSAPVSFTALINSPAITPSTFLAAQMHPLSHGSIREINPSSALLATKIIQPVELDMSGPGQVNLTKPIILSGFLRNISTGAGISNKTITFSSAGLYLGQTHTNDQGLFLMMINKDLTAGKYLLTATFKGAHLLAPTSGAVWFEVLPATVRIQTVPAIAGITFQMDGRQFMSGPNGYAAIQIDKVGKYQLDVLLDQYHDPSQQVEFGRWSEETFQPSRKVFVPSNEVVQVGLNVFHKVSWKFADLDGYPVDPARISSISIRSVQGDVFSLKPEDTPWLPSSRTARRQAGLEETNLLYSVNSVIIDGSNVVNSAQQRFFVKADDTWTITLLLYSLHITTSDGLFASPVGKSIDLIFPNGQVKNYPLDKSGVLEIHTLARGIYHVSLLGVKGLGTTTPVALSRNQVVKLNIVTKLDIAVFGMVSLGFAIGLVLYGRPRLLLNLVRRKHTSAAGVEWTTNNET